MGEDFLLPTGDIFPSKTAVIDRPRRKSIDTPALKVDTSVLVSVVERTDVNGLPPPPERKPQAKVVGIQQAPPEPVAEQTTGTHQDDSKNTTTPVMRSIFPRFDPAVRLSQQPYVPTIEQTLPVPKAPVANYSPSLYSQPQSPPLVLIAGDPWAASRMSSSMFQQSPGIVEEIPSNISTSEQLLDLWTIALGQDSPEALPSYTLALKCNSLRHNHESISLASDTADLYKIQASNSTISITRKHPLNSATGVTIAMPVIENSTTISPILAAIFPTVAKDRALETSKQIATEHQLPIKDATDLQVEAVQRAKRAEAGALLWDSDSSSYYFTLPSLKTQPDGQAQATALAIEYTPDKSIRFLNGSSEPLLALSLVNSTLVLETRAITSLSSSLYTLDILISTLLVLMLHLHRHDGLLAEPILVAPHFDPPPKTARKGQGVSSPRIPKKESSSSLRTTPWLSRLRPSSRAQSRLRQSPYGTTNDSTLTFDKDIELGSGIGSTIVPPHHIPPMTAPPIRPNGIAPELRASNTGVDLSRFQAFDLEDPDLGQGTRIALRLIYWGFSVTVWILGVLVGVLAAAVVAFGACFGGGKGSREG